MIGLANTVRRVAERTDEYLRLSAESCSLAATHIEHQMTSLESGIDAESIDTEIGAALESLQKSLEFREES